MQLFEEVRKKLKMPSYCPLCGKTLIVEEAAIDHIIPIRLGGTNDLDL